MEEIKKIRGEVEISSEISGDVKREVKNIAGLGKKIGQSLDKNTTEIIGIILAGAINLGSSDIHLEPEENQAKLRIRLDGVLQDVLIFDLKIYKSLLSRIKLLSSLKLNIINRPQDGRFSILFDETRIEIRTSSLPAEYGESMVLRILNPKSLVDLEALGLREDLLETFKKEIQKPNGMIIVTGPTGSGKTTTLYAFLRKINNPEIKIITIEDPIEYHLQGISQTQVDQKKGYDFANGLRAIVRQDPDVILVGEIRDLETSQIALQAALTGHLVFSTLHTNDAAGTIARLQALGEKPVNIAPAINMAVAQRLVRKICPKCSKVRPVSLEELNKFKKALKNLPKSIKIPEIDANMQIPETVGCDECNSTGFKGRVAVFEAFLVDSEIEKLIITSLTITALREMAIKKGMVTMYQDGIIKVLNGVTTIEEVEKITTED